MRFSTFAAAIFLGLSAVPVSAQSQLPSLSERAASADGAFEAGAFQALSAIERMIQSMNRYGIGRGFDTFMGFRMGVGRTTPFAPRKADTFASILQTFADDLEAARETLSQVDTDTAEPFVLDLKTVWFDINRNGKMDRGEEGVFVMGQVLPRRSRGEVPDGPIEVRFDGSDHAWLMAYTHVLSGVSETILAFDPTPVFADLLKGQEILRSLPTIPYTFDEEAIRAELDALVARQGTLRAEEEAKRAALEPIQQKLSEVRDDWRKADDDRKPELKVEMDRLQEELRAPQQEVYEITRKIRFLGQQIQSVEGKLPSAQSQDMVGMFMGRDRFDEVRNAIFAVFRILSQKPDPERIAKVESHFRAMLAQNRLFWETVMTETDNDREWVPNPSQVSAVGVEVDEELAAIWQAVLDDAEAVMDGRLLIAHPIIDADVGINIAAWFDNPSSLDLIGWLHGRDAYPYLARGPKINRSNWLALQRATGGNAVGFSFFLN